MNDNQQESAGMDQEKKDISLDTDLRIDEETDAMLEAIFDAETDDPRELVKIAKIDPDLFAAWAKANGKQDDPDVKAIIQAARERKEGPCP